MKCPLCGAAFGRQEALSACRGCPLARRCMLVRCPRCGYETVGETRAGALWQRLRSPRKTLRRSSAPQPQREESPAPARDGQVVAR